MCEGPHLDTCQSCEYLHFYMSSYGFLAELLHTECAALVYQPSLHHLDTCDSHEYLHFTHAVMGFLRSSCHKERAALVYQPFARHSTCLTLDFVISSGKVE